MRRWSERLADAWEGTADASRDGQRRRADAWELAMLGLLYLLGVLILLGVLGFVVAGIVVLARGGA